MMIYRKAESWETAACAHLGDICFDDVQSFRRLFPKAYDYEDSPVEHFIADADGRPVAQVGLLPNTMTVCGAELRTGFIGTVCVHPGERRAGHMKALMRMAVDSAREQRIDLLMLGGQRQRYEYFGFAKSGEIAGFALERATVRHALRDTEVGGVDFIEIRPGSPEEAAALAMHEDRLCRFRRSDPGFSQVCRSYGCRSWLMRRDGEGVGFLCACGNLLADVCVKNAADLRCLLKVWMLKTQADIQRIQLPVWETELTDDLALWAEDMSLEACVEARILNFRNVLETLLRLKATYCRLDDGVQSFCADGQRFTVSVKDNAVAVTDGGEDSVVLDAVQAGNCFLNPFIRRDNNWFPLPLFVPIPDQF